MSKKTMKQISVVSVPDKYTAVINAGEADGVAQGQRFLIFSIGAEVFDPETGESLGSIEHVKGRAEIVHIQEKISTVRSIEQVRTAGAKKIIRRKGVQLMAFGDTIEEIEENPIIEDKFLNAEIGDMARPI